MTGILRKPSIVEVDRELARPRRAMRFSPRVEQAFLGDYLADRAPMVPLWATLGTLFYSLAYLGDRSMMAAHADLLLFYRFGIFLPYAIGVIVAMRLWPSARLYEYLSIGVGVLGALLPMSVLAMSQGPYDFAYQTGTVSTLLFLVILLRPRFYAAVIGVVLILVIQLATTHLNGGFDDVIYGGIVTFYITFCAFLLLAAHSAEQAERRAFLHRLRNQLLTEQLRFQSEHDELSTLRNRRALTRLLETLWSTGKHRSVAAIMLDIDHFKLYNDVHGHIAGDSCIRMVSRIFTETLGEDGHAFRYGGEELLAILPGKGTAEATALAERVRATIEAAALPHNGLENRPDAIVTASLGAASLPVAGTTPGQLLAEADAALYDAKRKGRNQVQPSPEPV
jgi:diguanylate cyclase (GGDEF)-like protein